MPRYLIEETATPQVMAALLQNPEDRTEAVRPIFEAVGGNLEGFYMSFAKNKAFLIVDVPDQASLDAITVTIFSRGLLSSIRTTPIMTASEAVEVFKRAASVAYQPPGT